MKNFISFCFAVIFSIGFINAQDLIYTISGELNTEKVALDSILIENVSNNSRIVFGDLPAQDYYEINLINWKSTGVEQISDSPEFVVSQNIPGTLVLSNSKNISSSIQLSIYNTNGQKVYTSRNKILGTKNSFKIEIGVSGVYLVKIESPYGTQSFKTLGAENSKGYNVILIDNNKMQRENKSALVGQIEDFSYHTGDSLLVTVFKKDYLSVSKGLNITVSESVNFNLFDIVFTDPRDNNSYQTVKIGNQIWLAENMAYLPHVSPSSIESATDTIIYVHGYEGTDVSEAILSENFKKYGALYNWVAAQIISPEGWHLPSEDEWRQLEQSIGMTPEEILKIDRTGIDEGVKLKSESGWNGENGTNESGFSALPGGSCCPFYNIGNGGFWWASTEGVYFDETGMGRALNSDSNTIIVLGSYRKFGFSVRCIRD